jgi:hypothetical protein
LPGARHVLGQGWRIVFKTRCMTNSQKCEADADERPPWSEGGAEPALFAAFGADAAPIWGCKTVPRRQWCAHLAADAASHLHTTGREPRAQKSVTGQCAHVTAFERCDRRHKSAVRQRFIFWTPLASVAPSKK